MIDDGDGLNGEESDVPTSLVDTAQIVAHQHAAHHHHVHHHSNNGNSLSNGNNGKVAAGVALRASTTSPYHSPTPSMSSLSLPTSSSSSPDASPLLRGRRPAPMTITDSDNAYTPSPSSRSLDYGSSSAGGTAHQHTNEHGWNHHSNGHQHPHSHTHASLVHRNGGHAAHNAHRRSASTSFSPPQHTSSLFAYSPFGDTPLSGLSSTLAVGPSASQPPPIGTIPVSSSATTGGHMRSLSQGGTPAVAPFTSSAHVQHFDFKPRPVTPLTARSSLSPLSTSFTASSSHHSHGGHASIPSHHHGVALSPSSAQYGTIGQMTSQSSSSTPLTPRSMNGSMSSMHGPSSPSPPQGLTITVPAAIGTPSPSHRTVRVVPSPNHESLHINGDRERMERIERNGERVSISVTIPSSSPSPTLSALQTSLMPPPLPVFFPGMATTGNGAGAGNGHGMPSTITEEPSSPMAGDRSPSAAAFANGSASPQRECIQYARNGVCPRGAGCTFKHSSRKSRPCKYFLRGRCVDDAKCEFSHSKHWLSAFAAASSPTSSSTSGGVAALSLFSPFECALCGKHFTGVKQKQQHEEGREHKHNMTVHYLNSLLGKVPFTGDNCFNCGQLGHKFSDCSFGFCRFFANRECRNGAQCALPHIGY
jgi:hypothetical protein